MLFIANCVSWRGVTLINARCRANAKIQGRWNICTENTWLKDDTNTARQQETLIVLWFWLVLVIFKNDALKCFLTQGDIIEISHYSHRVSCAHSLFFNRKIRVLDLNSFQSPAVLLSFLSILTGSAWVPGQTEQVQWHSRGLLPGWTSAVPWKQKRKLRRNHFEEEEFCKTLSASENKVDKLVKIPVK